MAEVPEADRNQQITVQVDADSAFKSRAENDLNSRKSQWTDYDPYPLGWPEGNNRHQGRCPMVHHLM